MAVPDPMDTRLLALVAEVGRVAVHDLAARAGLDVREVAARLAALAETGLPLVVGVECDQPALRYALATQSWPHARPAAAGAGSGPHRMGAPPNPYPEAGQLPPGQIPPGQHPPAQPPPGQFPPGQLPPRQSTAQQPTAGYPPAGPSPGRPAPTGQAFAEVGPPGPAGQAVADLWPLTAEPMSTWGPPQTAAWARGDQEPFTGTRAVPPVTAPAVLPAADPHESGRRNGKVGDVLCTEGVEGERLAIRLVEVVDPADYLFTAAGYRLRPGERSVVVHTELTNRGAVPFRSLPDLYLVLVTAGGATASKAPVSLSSRPPHRIGLQPGEAAGGHTVYVLPEDTELAAVRWSCRPDDDSQALTWSLTG